MVNTAVLDDKVVCAVLRRDDDLSEALFEPLEVTLMELSDFSDVILDFVPDFWVFVSFSSVVLLSSSSSSSSFKLLAKVPRLSKMLCTLGTSGWSGSNSSITSSRPLWRHPSVLKMSKILPLSRHESSYDGGGLGGCMPSKSLRRSCSVSSILRTKDSLGPSSSTISDRVLASLVISKIAPTSNMPCGLAADPVGFQYTVEMPLLGPDVIVLERISGPSPNARDDVLAEIAKPERELERTLRN